MPREVRRMLGVRTGDKLLFESDGKGMRVRPIRNKSAFSKYCGIGYPDIPTGRKSIGKWLRGMRGECPLRSTQTWLLRCGTKTRAWPRKTLWTRLSVAGHLVVAAPVFSELIAAPGRSENFVGSFFEEIGIGIDRELSEQIWRLAGRAFQAYAERRRTQGDKGTRRVLATSSLVRTHSQNGFRLLTLDERLYRAAFPSLAIETF